MATEWALIREAKTLVNEKLKELDDYIDQHDTFGDLEGLNQEYAPEAMREKISAGLRKAKDLLNAAVGDTDDEPSTPGQSNPNTFS